MVICISGAKFTFSFHTAKLFPNDLMSMEDFRLFLDNICKKKKKYERKLVGYKRKSYLCIDLELDIFFSSYSCLLKTK